MAFRFEFADSDRMIFVYKVLPVLFTGSAIWLISQVLFNYIFVSQTILSQEFFLVFYIVMTILNGVLFLLFYVSSRSGNEFYGIFFYLSFAFTAGTIPVPISMIIVLDQALKTYVNAFVSLVFGGTLIVFFMGIIFRWNFFKRKYIFLHVLIFVIGIICLEILFLVIYGVSNPILIAVSTLVMITATIVILFYGISLSSKMKGDYWIYVVFRIIFSLLLISLIFLIIVIVLVIAMVVQDDLALDGLFYSPSGGKTKKNKKKYLKEPT
ncbi:MAG: hypothetical protein JW891_02090 [Candidatus Lokiarchaeota archaeon]|nr:hypothetical protein [Candidatus Lokiarchaeota archaeon]